MLLSTSTVARLNKLVFERRDAERSLPPVRLGDVHPTHRFGPVRSALQSMGEVLEIFLKGLAVVPPRLPVYTGCRLPLQLRVSKPQGVDPVDVMHQSGELYILVRFCRLSYLRQLAWRDYPALSPERVLLAQIPLGQTPSLHLLRRQLLQPCSETSPVLWVCPTSRVRSSSAPVLGLPDASREHWPLSGEPGTSQLPCKMCPYVPGSQTAQDPGEARIYAPPNVAFRVVSGRRRPEVRGISRLDNLARSSSCLRFVSGLAAMPARLGAGVAR